MLISMYIEFTVALKSPHTLTVSSVLGTRAMGAAQSLYFTLSIVPNFSMRIKSFSITGCKAYGADLSLQNLGLHLV